MTEYTPKLGLLVPDIDDELTALRENWTRLDTGFSGATWIAAGTTPDDSTLSDGALVAEIGTGKVWRAYKNSNGQFEKKWVKFPWLIRCEQAAQFWPTDVAQHDWGWQSVRADMSINATSADLVGNRLVIPQDGIYIGMDYMRWNFNFAASPPVGSGGYRRHSLKINDTYDDNNYQQIIAPYYINFVTSQIPIVRKMSKGDVLCASIWQNSNAYQDTYHALVLALARPL